MHPPVLSPVMPDVFDRSRAFRLISRGREGMSRDSSASRGSKPKSHSSSRATSRMSGANFDWVGDFMKKFADDASSRERRLVEEAQEREKDLRSMAVEREKEIRADMRQLAASEARVAALEQQLKDKVSLPLKPQGVGLTRRERPYFSDHPPKSWTMPWCPSPVVSDHVTSVPTSVPSYDWYYFTMTPSSAFDDTSYPVINLSTCNGVSTDTTTVSVVKPRASVPTFGGPQQSSFCPMCPTVQPPTAVSTLLLSSSNLVPVQHPPQGLAMPTVPTGVEGQMSNLSLSSVSLGVTQGLISSVPGSGVPTTAVTDQRPVITNSLVSAPIVGTTAFVVAPTVANVPSPMVAAWPTTGMISVFPSSDTVTPSSSTIALIAPSSISSSLPVGTSVSSSSASLSQPLYQPLVVVNTPQLVRPYNSATSWTSFRDHFKRVAKVDRWDDDSTKAQHLMLALEGNVAEVLKEILDSSPTVLQDIWDALSRRFGEVDEARKAMRKFEQRRQLDTESVVEFEQALRSLYRVAWPKAAPKQKEAALKTRFEEGLVRRDMQQYLRLHALGDTFANTVQKVRRFAATTEVPRSRKSVRITPPAHEAVQIIKGDSSLHQRLDKLEDMIQSLQVTSRTDTPPPKSSNVGVGRQSQRQFPTSRTSGEARDNGRKSPQNRRQFIRPFDANINEPRPTQTETNRSASGSGLPSGRDNSNQNLMRAGASGGSNVQRPPGVPPGVCWVCRQPFQVP